MHTHTRQHGFLGGPGRGLNFFRIRELWLQSKAAAKNCTNLTNERARACGFQSPRITPTQRHSQNEFGQSVFILSEFICIPAENIKEIKPTLHLRTIRMREYFDKL